MGRDSGKGRRVTQSIDGGGIYASRVAVGGSWVFFSGSAVDSLGRVRGVDGLPAPYRASPVAQVRSQAGFFFSQVREAFDELGITFEDVTQIEQNIQRKVQHDGFLEVSRDKDVFARNRPNSALFAPGDYLPSAAVFTVNGIAFIPTDKYPGKEIFRTDLAWPRPKHKLDLILPADRFPQFQRHLPDEAPYSEVVAAGPYVFTTVLASDFATGPHADVKIGSWSSWGSEMRNEAYYMVLSLTKQLEVGGTTVDNVVHCSAYLQEMSDLFELDAVWAKLFPKDPPARTLIPTRGLGQPRIEGAKHHWEGSNKMELQFRSIRPGHGVEREVISLPGSVLPGIESDAVRVGDLLWIGGQMAADREGPATSGDTESQLNHIFDRIAAICEEGSSRLTDLVRIRAFVVDEATGYAFFAKLKERVPKEPPAVSVLVVSDPLPIPNCTISIDAVSYAG